MRRGGEVNGSSTGTPVGSKSDTLRVATIQLAMFKCGSGHRQVATLIADSLRQTAPAACHGDIDRKNPALVGSQNHVEPNSEARCERRIELPLSFDPSFDFVDRDPADEKIARRHPADPLNQIAAALVLRFAQFGKNKNIKSQGRACGLQVAQTATHL
jgi:hypothetical protein